MHAVELSSTFAYSLLKLRALRKIGPKTINCQALGKF